MITQENLPYTADEVKAMVKTCEKYNKALERAKDMLAYKEVRKEDIEYLFPELKEDENQRIRKELKHYLDVRRCLTTDDEEYITCNHFIDWLEKQGKKKPYEWHREDEQMIERLKSCVYAADLTIEGRNELIAWLEEQGEQKPTDKTGPKFNFKVGDWIANREGECYKIKSIYNVDGRYYIAADKDGEDCRIYFGTVNEYFHLWTIRDAKDGDVLCTYECDEPKIVFILKGTPKKHYVLSYRCYYNIMYPYFNSDSENGCLAPKDENVKPATKEQRDLLFHKMEEAGYEWDNEKKCLTKI